MERRSPLSPNAASTPDRTENWDLYLIEAKAGAKERQLTTTPEADAHPDWESAPGLESGWQNDRLHSRRRSKKDRIRDAFARHHSGGRWRGEDSDRRSRPQRGPSRTGRQMGNRFLLSWRTTVPKHWCASRRTSQTEALSPATRQSRWSEAAAKSRPTT